MNISLYAGTRHFPSGKGKKDVTTDQVADESKDVDDKVWWKTDLFIKHLDNTLSKWKGKKDVTTDSIR